MVHHYTQLPISQPHRQVTQHDREVEMQAAFDYSDDEDDEHTTSEAHPLNHVSAAPISLQTPTHIPGTYNFDTVDYDYPPPGSPPPPSAVALPNNHGNSNGLVPEFDPISSHRPHRIWFHRAAAKLLPSSVLSAVGLTLPRPSGPIGGGTNNDGVFANVTAKPTAPNRVQDGDDMYVVPEDARQEAPPSYASAQADAVPPYWETTVHAPFASDSIGDMVIDSLPTGSLFSFCWNLLVSISFQFVGFLLTYLLHTSHAARLGSRAGLGVTLIQYGFALRNHINPSDGVIDKSDWSDWSTDSPLGSNGPRHGHHPSNVTWGSPIGNMTEQPKIAGATTEWLSFLLMTIGWFVLLTSLLGFWRVKRWERGVLAAQRDSSVPSQRNPTFVSPFESSFGLRGISRIELLRQGFGFGRRGHQGDDEVTRAVLQAEEGGPQLTPRETDPMISTDSSDPQRARAIAQALESDRRLHRHLHEAGFI